MILKIKYANLPFLLRPLQKMCLGMLLELFQMNGMTLKVLCPLIRKEHFQCLILQWIARQFFQRSAGWRVVIAPGLWLGPLLNLNQHTILMNDQKKKTKTIPFTWKPWVAAPVALCIIQYCLNVKGTTQSGVCLKRSTL